MPAADRRFAYVSSGTWSLVGVELDQPVLTEASRAANFTNEGGVDGRVRYLRNVGGLWLLQESLRTWREAGEPADQDALLAEAARLPAGGPVVDVDAARVHPARRHAGPDPRGLRGRRAAGARHCRPRSSAASSTRWPSRTRGRSPRPAGCPGQPVDVIHIVGGGCQNALLCQLTADLSGRPVLAGPVEATALGNVAVQARAAGRLPGTLEELRTALRARPEPAALRAAARALRGGGGRSEDRAVRHLPGRRAVSAGRPGDREPAGAAGARGRLPGRPDLLRPDARQHRLPEAGAAAGGAVRRGVRRRRRRGRAVRLLRRVGPAPARDGGPAVRHGRAWSRRSSTWRRRPTSCPSCWSTCWA